MTKTSCKTVLSAFVFSWAVVFSATETPAASHSVGRDRSNGDIRFGTDGFVRIGGTLRWESGLPYSLLASRLTAYNQPLDYLGLGTRDIRSRIRYPTGQRNDQRNPSFWTVDLRVAKEFHISRDVQLQLTAEVFNLLDDRTLTLESITNGQAAGARRFGRSFQLGLRLAF